MRVGVYLFLAIALSIEPALAQSLADGRGMEPLGSVMAAFPGGESLAITAFCIAAGTLLLRLTKWLGLALTFATFGFLAVVLLLAVEPRALARLIEAVTLS
jgi:hypothetical protein